MQPNQVIEKAQLSGRLEEFRSALEEEIYAARLNAIGNGLLIKSGRKIAQTGITYQYVFLLDNVTSLPVDSPGELHVPNYSPTDVTIISIDGMSLILSSRIDFGNFISAAKLVSNLTFLMKKLIERIEELSSQQNSTGDRILGNIFKTINQWTLPIIYDPPLNGGQIEAIRSSLCRNLTFIWGPPEPGKTMTIGAIGNYLQSENRSLLMVSHTNTAVDQALLQIAKSASEEILSNGKILRIGEPKDPKISKEYPDLLLETHVARRSKELTTKLETIKSEVGQSREKYTQLISEIDFYDWFVNARKDLDDLHHKKSQWIKMEVDLENLKALLKALKDKEEYWAEAKISASRIIKNKPKLELYEEKSTDLNLRLEKFQSENKQILDATKKAEVILHDAESVNWITRKWRGLPEPEAQRQWLNQLYSKATNSTNQCLLLSDEIASNEENIRRFTQESSEFKSKYLGDLDEILQKERAFQQKLLQTVDLEKIAQNQYKLLKNILVKVFRGKLDFLQSFGYQKGNPVSIPEMYSVIEKIFSEIYNKTKDVDIQQTRAMLQRTIKRIAEIEAEIGSIEKILGKIEEVIISEADIIATTLTRAYLKESIRARKFDTIIIDEASMAPIPAIWVAASLAENNAVIVGDWKQLPPIVISEKENARNWLGRDIYEVANVIDTEPENRIDLNAQFRMNDQIASIVNNKMFYGGNWKLSGPSPDENFFNWYNPNWTPEDHPVKLIDTGPLDAWVTSVPQGKSSSRLNFLSALLCIDICKMLLITNRMKKRDNEKDRIFIVSLYRPHTELLNKLILDNNLGDDVRGGTIHSFQGSEANIVIFDLVNDEPHWKVALFTPDMDDMTKRLVNVGITRALNRLIIVGDFSYIQKMAKNAFLGKEFIPFLKDNYKTYNAIEIIPHGLKTRAANAIRLYSKGSIEGDATRIIVTQDDFYPLFLNDIHAAKNRIVIYSPFMTQNRIGELQSSLLSAIEKNITVFIVTKPIQERNKREIPQYKFVEKSLRDWGITIVHKNGMHEKLVIVDDDIIWSGSLNPLSFSNTQEIMERRISENLVKEYFRISMFNALIGEYDDGPPKCPICESEMVASEGRNNPFYWTCVTKDCYSRGIDQPRIKNGVIACSNSDCDGEVEFGTWGEEPAWRCVKNKRHHQKMVSTHLKLPQMRKKIPQDLLTKLEINFGAFSKDMNEDNNSITQLSLFE